jgi:hypothetical protein
MKRIVLFSSLLTFTFNSSLSVAQLYKNEWRISSGIGVPFKSEMPKMSIGYQYGMSYSFKPLKFVPIGLDFKTNFSTYSLKTIEQTFVFSDGSGTRTDVTYTSKFNHTLIGTKFLLGNDYKRINGFLTPQIGFGTMKSRISVADPQDEDDCEVLESERTHLDCGFVYGGEVGVNVDLSVLAKNVEENKFFLTLSGSFLNSSSDFRYVNIKYMKDHEHALHTGGEMLPVTEDGREDITAQFINVSTNSIHEHKIAELYKTGLRMWQVSLGFTIRF